VLIAQAVFLLERGQTDATERPNHTGGYAVMGNKRKTHMKHSITTDSVALINFKSNNKM